MSPPKKLAVLGATGMLGHRLALHLAGRFQVVGTVRQPHPWLTSRLESRGGQLAAGVDAFRLDTVQAFLEEHRPDVVLNCIGVVKQLPSAKDHVNCITINALFPHQLSRLCGDMGIRTVHFSTDCVFSGDHAPYGEAAPADPRDLYGRSKLLGEVNAPGALTLRTSIIGHEFTNQTGLVEWVMSQKGRRASGFARAIYTGVTTNYMARAIERILLEHPILQGVWHLSSDPISKYDLIGKINHVYELGIALDRDEQFVCDRRLDSTLLRGAAGIVPPSWDDMLLAMHQCYLEDYIS